MRVTPEGLTRPSVGIWGPFVAVMLVLGALAVTPMLTTARARRLRAPLTDAAEPALVLVNDLEATLAAELYAAAAWARTGGPAARARYDRAVAAERRDLAALTRLVARVDGPTGRDLAAVTAAARRWHAASGTDEALGLAALDATQRLDADLERFVAARRADLRRSNQLDLWTAAALAPLAALGVLLLAWTSWRMASLARLAEARRDRLAEAARAREALLRGVSHDLRNPLGAAAAYLSMLGTGDFGDVAPAQRDAVRRAERLVRSALRTTTDLLDLARADAGQLPVRDVPVAMDALVREVVDDHAASAASAGLRLDVGVERDGASHDVAATELTTDPERVRQVLANLLSNAIKYTPRGGAVEVRLHRPNGVVRPEWLAIEVRDTGPGIPVEHRERVFEEAVRLPAAHRVAPGAGIGLATARRVARALGGDLTVDEAPTGGAAFTLWLGAGRPSGAARHVDAGA
jgi:signal transduction histidine kinase